MYHVATDNQVPYWIYTNMQDDGTMRGPSSARAAPDEENPEDVNTRPAGEEREVKAKTERKNAAGDNEDREASENAAEHETGSESESLKPKDQRPHAGGLEGGPPALVTQISTPPKRLTVSAINSRT